MDLPGRLSARLYSNRRSQGDQAGPHPDDLQKKKTKKKNKKV